VADDTFPIRSSHSYGMGAYSGEADHDSDLMTIGIPA
jgi:hypothetical protein